MVVNKNFTDFIQYFYSPDETFLFHVLSSIGIIEDYIKRQFVGYQGNKIILQDYSLQCRIPKGDVRIFHLYNFDDQIRFQGKLSFMCFLFSRS